MTDEEVSAKFQDCTRKALGQKETEKVMGMLHTLESLEDISESHETHHLNRNRRTRGGLSLGASSPDFLYVFHDEF